MSLGSWPPKDPAETLDYTIDWTLRLNGDTIVSSTWALPAGSALVTSNPAFITNMTKVWLSAGTLGQVYTLVNTVITAGGETMVESVQILMQAK